MMNQDVKRVVTGKVRLSYCHLLQPRALEGQKPKYSVTLLIPKSDIATKQRIDVAIQAAISEGVTSKWNGARPAQPAIPLYDGDGVRPTGEAFGEECRGHWVMTASSEQKPEVVDANLAHIISPTEIYSGMYGRVSIRFFPYLATGKKGIGCGLNNVQKLEDGEPLGGRSNAASDFGDGFAPIPQYQQQPVYQQPAAPQYQQPVYQQPTPQYQQQIDPITGLPISGVFGI